MEIYDIKVPSLARMMDIRNMNGTIGWIKLCDGYFWASPQNKRLKK